MNSAPELIGNPINTFDTLTAGLYQAGFSPTTGINASLLRLGSRCITRDGRVFRFARVGAVAAVAGSLYQSSAPVPNHLAQTPAAASVGATSVTITTLGATAATQNQYAEGLMQVDTTPGNGLMYGIDSHLANAGSAAFIVNLAKDDSIQVALTTSSRVGFFANPYADLIVTPTVRTAVCVGVPLVAAAIAAYCWIQTWGPAPVLINGTPAVTNWACNSGTTAGAVDAFVPTTAVAPTQQVVGQMMQIGVSTKNNAVFLMISP